MGILRLHHTINFRKIKITELPVDDADVFRNPAFVWIDSIQAFTKGTLVVVM